MKHTPRDKNKEEHSLYTMSLVKDESMEYINI